MSPTILSWPEIATKLEEVDVIAAMAEGFDLYSQGKAVIPPVGEMQFDDPPGDVHIKYGYLKGGTHYVVKIASGFYDNPKRGIGSSQGCMLLFDQQTGCLEAVLLDDGRLTDTRTAAAGALAAKHLAGDIHAIGILGTGTQARCQLDYLRRITSCRRVVAWGRNAERLDRYASFAEGLGMTVQAAQSAEQVAATCNLIVTTTPAREPLLLADWVQPGTHVTAVGADAAEKQELDVQLLGRAQLVVCDSRSQCETRGEIHHAVRAGVIALTDVVELGDVVSGRIAGRPSDDAITIADLTGVAVQDLQIAVAVSVSGLHP